MSNPPHIDSTPGLAWKPRKIGWEARWQARTDLAKRGYEPKSCQLWVGTEPSDKDRVWIQSRCQFLQTEMLVWGRGGIPILSSFDGTLKGLIACYQTDKDSGYRLLRYKTRENYDILCRRLEIDHGSDLIADIRARSLRRWHEDWTANGRVAMAHSLIGMLRTVIGFGATFIEDDECQRAKGILHDLRFKMAKPRNERLTADQANAIRAKAHEMGRPSIALAQAFQYEGILRQKDVIGEWVPVSEPGVSEVVSGNAKWLRGIRWSEIDGNLILRHTTSKRQKDVEVDLKLAPMVMDELSALCGQLPASGPVIICEPKGIPWTNYEFRRWWRKVADACGIPKAVYNMDSRAGAISEATDAGAELEHIRHAATHGDIAMTQRYSRGSVEKTANVMKLRAAHRSKNDPGT